MHFYKGLKFKNKHVGIWVYVANIMGEDIVYRSYSGGQWRSHVNALLNNKDLVYEHSFKEYSKWCTE